MLVTKDLKQVATGMRFSSEDLEYVEFIAGKKKLFRKNGTFSKTKVLRLILKEYAHSLGYKKKA